MRQCKFKIFLVMLLTAIDGVSLANDFSVSYGTDIYLNDNVLQIYKLRDSNGRITYSSFIQDDSVEVEKIDVVSPPTDTDVVETRLRSQKLKAIAVQLSEARVKRERIRQERETRRLERLALINQSRPLVYEKNIYTGYPYQYWGAYLGDGHHRPHKSAHRPSAVHRATNLTLPSSSFSSVLHR